MFDFNSNNRTVAILKEWSDNFDKRQRRFTLFFAIAIILVIIIGAGSLIWFQNDNHDRILNQNINFIQDSAVQESYQIEREMNSAVKTVENFAQQYAAISRLEGQSNIKKNILSIADETMFDHISFAASNGKNQGLRKDIDVSNRSYFKDGMKGNKGWQFIARSAATEDSAVVFYAPVKVDNKVIGVLLGFYDRERLNEILSYEMLNYKPETYLLKEDGTIITSSKGEKEEYTNVLEVLSKKEFTGDINYQSIKDLIEDDNKKTTTFTFKEANNKITIGVVAQFKNSRWLIMSFLPYDVTEKMLLKANTAGKRMMITMLLEFLAVIIVLIYALRKQKGLYKNEMAYAIDNIEKSTQKERRQFSIINSLAEMFSTVYYIEYQNREYQRIKGEKVNVMEDKGKWQECIDSYVEALIGNEYAEGFRELTDIDMIEKKTREGIELQAFEYQRTDAEWRRGYMIPIASDNSDIEEIIGFIFAVQSISEEKKKELEAKQALSEAYDAAQIASNAKTTFLANMSHDIRTPMNAIVGMTAIAAANISNQEKVSDCLEKITASSRHLLGLINEILDMSKIESGKIDLVEENFNLSEMIDEMLDLNKPQLKAKNHSLTVTIKNIVHENVVGDRTRLQQVFTNLLSNAIKYTPDNGKIEIAISEKQTNKNTVGWYEVIFKDNGIGMSEEFRKVIFEPFARANDKRTKSVQGTGLGMSIALNIIRMMNGDIKVESKTNEGSTFTVSFALKLQDDEVADYEEFADLPILVVDDDVIACESTCAVLDNIKMNSEWVTTGREAVERVVARHERDDDYYAVIVDWVMPGMNGIEVTREIRKQVGNEIPIIIISAYDWVDIEEEARAAGINAFLAKPIFKSKVVTTFRNFINNSRPLGCTRACGRTGAETCGNEICERNEDETENAFGYDFAGKRMLVVEDNEMNQEIATEIMSMAGFEVEVAENGEVGAEKFIASEEGYYDVILMDIQMPVMDGYEATKVIRTSTHPAAKTIPIVAMTANAFSTDVRKSFEAGMNGHVSKPIDVDKVLETLTDIISGGGTNKTEKKDYRSIQIT